MALFGLGKKDKRAESAEKARKLAEARRKELEKIVRSAPSAVLPGHVEFKSYPTEYKEFLKEIKAKPLSVYERAADIAKKILPIKPPQGFLGIDSAAKAGYLAVDSAGVVALTILTALVLFGVTVAAAMLNLGPAMLLFLLVVTAVGTWLVLNYPDANALAVTNRISADSVLAILYMVIWMRTSPNLEGALRFSADTLTGPLSWDLKKLLWDVQLGAYPSADAALAGYADKWKKENVEFAEAINLLRGSAVEPVKRAKLYDEVVNLILRGTAERTKHYVGGLRMPVMLIHALGVLLPVMGLVLFPIIVIFMSDSVSAFSLFIVYDVLLPIALLLLIDNILRARPPTFSQPDISLAKGVPPLGKIRLGDRLIPIWPIALLVSLPAMLLAYQGIASCLVPVGEEAIRACAPRSFDYVNLSMLGIAAAGLGVAVYGLLDSWQKMKIRNDIEKIESEFGVALFQMGSAVSGGSPIELAVDKAAAGLKGMTIAELFTRTSDNMKKFGYTFEQAMFDPTVGAVWFFPSRLIRSIMVTIMESSKKGMASASDAMLTIATYLRGVHSVKEEVSEVLGETLSSMKFLAMLLTPMVAGVTITMAVVIIQILVDLGSQLSVLTAAGADMPTGTNLFVLPWLQGGGIAITPAMFQLIVGVYMLEIAMILSMFLNRIEFGEDAVGLRNELGKTVLIAMAVYAMSWLLTFAIFGGSIRGLLTPVVSVAPTGGV
jgi:hypothetical protein